MKCFKCNKSVSNGHEEQYLAPSNFKPSILHFCSECHSTWEGSDCQKNYDQRRLKALEAESEESRQEHNNLFNDEIKAIKSKWNIKDEPRQQNPTPTGNKGMSGGMIALLVIGGILLLGLIGWYFYRQWKKEKDAEEDEL